MLFDGRAEVFPEGFGRSEKPGHEEAHLRPEFAKVIAIDGDGHVLMNLHEPAARFPTLTGVLETRDALYLTTLFGQQLPRINKRDLYVQ